MYFYAVLYTLSFALNELTIADTGVIASGAYAWLISGMIMIVVVVVYLVRFLCKYPLPTEEVSGVIK
jgi:ABC-type siderophore export system fused ATPase/permease subunit